MLRLKTPDELRRMREAGRVVADILNALRDVVRPGVPTAELDNVASRYIQESGGTASFKGYCPSREQSPFPGAVCVSINEEVVHGFPSKTRFLEDGDIVSVDVGVFLNGYHGDAACTYPVGAVSPERAKLLSVTEESLSRAIAAAVLGNTVGDIGHAVESYVKAQGMGVVRDYTGHGVGHSLHEAPQVPNFGHPKDGVTLLKGMTLAIEPMVMAGKEAIKVGADNWLVVTADGSDAAHFERSVAITDDGINVLCPP